MPAILVFPRATPALVRAHLRPGARVLAIDAGAEALRALDVAPDLAVGDMDSVTPETLAWLERRGVPIDRHAREKRDSDAALALAHVKDEEDVLFVGPGGGRVDHALANLHLLGAAGGRARAVDEDAETWVVAPERPLALRLPEGELLSVLPFGGPAEGVTYDGLRYPLVEATMRPGDPYGLSNVALAPPQRVSVRRGLLLVIRPLPPSLP